MLIREKVSGAATIADQSRTNCDSTRVSRGTVWSYPSYLVQQIQYSQNSGQERRGQGATIADQSRDFVGDSKIYLHVSALMI